MKAHEEKAHQEKTHEQTELERLDAAERAGELLTGEQRGRLADLRRADILLAVEAMLHQDKTLPGKTVETATIPSGTYVSHRK